MRGYAPDGGYDFLLQAIAENDFRKHGIHIDTDEIFVSDGAKSDTGNIGDILGIGNNVAITDPAYPVYVDTNRMAGRKIQLLPCTPKNNFVPEFPVTPPDIVYICSPNNPTGTALNRQQLTDWVAYANKHNTLILFDAAYEAFISDPNIPHSIFEIKDAQNVAIEFRSFSKTAGFTGLRASYTVVPKQLVAKTTSGETVALNNLWKRRQSTKFNGTPYIVQRAAEAVYSTEGQQQIRETINYYKQNATVIKNTLHKLGIKAYGGDNAPYIWSETPNKLDSWAFFDLLLNQAQVVGTPGSGFGKAGEGFFRFTAFGNHNDTLEAAQRIEQLQY
jgi:LL-diaminopimelate aminotransferase